MISKVPRKRRRREDSKSNYCCHATTSMDDSSHTCSIDDSSPSCSNNVICCASSPPHDAIATTSDSTREYFFTHPQRRIALKEAANSKSPRNNRSRHRRRRNRRLHNIFSLSRIKALTVMYLVLIFLVASTFPIISTAAAATKATTAMKGSKGSDFESDQNDTNIQQQHQRRQQQTTNTKDEDSVLILVSVDGTLAGVSRSTGEVLWKRSQNDAVSTAPSATANDDDDNNASLLSAKTVNKFLSPLVSTTTKSNSGLSSLQWHAVPSIDGIVYLTGGGDPINESSPSPSSRELSISTHIRDLVDRAPFVDAHGRFFVGSRRASVAAVDERTGEILRVIPKWKGSEKKNQKPTDDNDGNGNNINDDYDDDSDYDEEEFMPSLEGRDVVWIGRLEHSVTVHDLQKNTVDVEFSVAEILSVDEMIHGMRSDRSSLLIRDDGTSSSSDKGAGDSNQNGDDGDDDIMQRLFTEYIAEALRHPRSGNRILSLPAPNDGVVVDNNDNKFDKTAYASAAAGGGSSFLVSTPGGNVAFRDSISSDLGWVAFEMMNNPVVYAIEGATGEKIRVHVLPDGSTTDSSASDPSQDSIPQIFEQQIASLIYSSLLTSGSTNEDCSDDANNEECRAIALAEQGSVVGALQDGQLYALPLGGRSPSRPHQLPLSLPQPNQKSKEEAIEQIHNKPLNQHHAIGFHDHNTDDSGGDSDAGDKQHVHVDPRFISSCTPKSPLYPGCLIGASLMMGNLLDVNGNLDMASVFASADLDYDLYLDMMEGKSAKKNSIFQQFIKILSSWIAPTVALIFVVSFEFGRRERLKVIAKSPSNEYLDGKATAGNDSKDTNKATTQGVIQLSDEVLGYGGHGTIVYKGVVDKRQVAVKRLLKIYASSADREISLLIESDGHPNVVRYFLKEIRGDFVYLALELCDMSLNDLIVCLGKLRNSRKTDDFESATRSLLYQIASGVRHIHSLRIVHRDLKPQNILLAQRSKLKGDEACSHSEADADENTILEGFKNMEYVPKISDMGLGKQLAGQSSFGLSTLGTGSVGGPAGSASVAGAGAGSVGWQAPEVMAMRWSPETSSTNSESESCVEASPLEVGRTSRSVDIFSLGCIFYCTILPGSHPFGEWYEREANIMKNKPNKDDLEFVAPDASDLILSMIDRDAKARPTAEEVCNHPFFWSLSQRLKFLCELSDRIELCDVAQEDNKDKNLSLNVFAIEKGAFEVFGTSWEKKLDPELMDASLSRRTYDPSSVRDILRMIRNKHHHYDELPSSLKSRIGSSTDGLSRYIMKQFPRLLMHCYNFCVCNLGPDDPLSKDYKLPRSRLSQNIQSAKADVTALLQLSEQKKGLSLEPIPDDLEQEDEQQKESDEKDGLGSLAPSLDEESDSLLTSAADDTVAEAPSAPEARIDEDESVKDADGVILTDEEMSGIVVWCGSNAAKQLNCRGWFRSDDEWEQRLDAKLRKRDANLARCADDPKFRTRLCNHWDVSGGSYCPMRKKNKCIFAHGPVELRVKEGKRHRWGTLVNKHGLCANPKASGGEDTYGIARSVENTRKEQGQWKGDTPKKGAKGKPKGKPGKKKE
jgi:serine/threonine protein kinase